MHCGIDFGTSNSAVALADGKKIYLAAVEGKHLTLPSALFYGTAGKPAFGRAAIKNFFDGDEGRFMRSLKRVLGTDLMRQGTVINGRMRKFEDIIGDFVTHLKVRAEDAAGSPIDSVVMGRPVHFIDGDTARDAEAEKQLGVIAARAGFKHIDFQFEPIAAAFAHEQKIAGEKLALVADIGGGTSDFTVIRLSKKYQSKADRSSDILANTGARVGGNDLDKSLSLSSFMPQMGHGTTYGEKNLLAPNTIFHELSEWSKVNFIYTPANRNMVHRLLRESHAPDRISRLMHVIDHETGHKLLAVVEASKIALTDATSFAADLSFIENGLAVETTQSGFDAAIAGETEKIDAEITSCLQEAGVNAEDISLIILTGGTTEVPLVNQAIKSRFPHAEISEADKLGSVGFGLGFDAARKFG